MNEQKSDRDVRADRLRSALRENLKRRKAQSKAKSGRADAHTGDSNAAADVPGSPNSAGFARDKVKG